ncbi:unnamed protein product [Angiostrongylus costaricensis]|uniref:CA domain-containing protein n=1 Tax=Angiostrongylus costaricensis TaxID=334426 RepID=A0A158PJE9_ANGCS|nr:unnamed protein product [Angiostrongylus costaricensis]
MIIRLFCFFFSLLISITLCCLLENGRSAVYLSVPEDVEPGEVIGHMPIEGGTDGLNPHVELRVVKGDDIAQILPNSKKLVLEKKLDRDEGQGKFELVVECLSQNLDSDFSQLNISVFITVQDVNDNPPVFDAIEYNITIKEELPIGTIVFTDFEATDRDQPGPNSFVLYSIGSGPLSELFEISDPFRPVVAVKNDEVVVEPEAIKASDGDELDADIEYGIFGGNFLQVQHFLSKQRRREAEKESSAVDELVHATFLPAREKGSSEKNTTAIFSLILEKTIRFEYDSYSIKDSAVRYSLGNAYAVVSIGETTGQLTYSGLLKAKAGIIQYELLATNRIEAAKAQLIVIVETESDYCARMEFEKSEYHLQIGSLPVLGTINVRGQKKPDYKLMNMNKYFLVDRDGVVRLQQNSRPPCGICELVVLATRDDGATSVAKITVRNPSSTVSQSSILTVMVFIIIAFVVSLLLVFVFRKMHYVSHYVVNVDKEKNFEATKSPAPKRTAGAHLVPVTVTTHDGAPTVYF